MPFVGEALKAMITGGLADSNMNSANGGLGWGRGYGRSWSGNFGSGGQLGGAGAPGWAGYLEGAAPSSGNAMGSGVRAGGLAPTENGMNGWVRRVAQSGRGYVGDGVPLRGAPTAIVFGSDTLPPVGMSPANTPFSSVGSSSDFSSYQSGSGVHVFHGAHCPHRRIVSSELHGGTRIHHEAYEVRVQGPAVAGTRLMTPSDILSPPGANSLSSQRSDIGEDSGLRAPFTQRYRSPLPELSTHSQSSLPPMRITGSYSLALDNYAGVGGPGPTTGLMASINQRGHSFGVGGLGQQHQNQADEDDENELTLLPSSQ